MKTTTSWATRAVLNERAIVVQWKGWLATQSSPPPPKSAPGFTETIAVGIVTSLVQTGDCKFDHCFNH